MNVHEVLAFRRLMLLVDARHRRILEEVTGPARDLYERAIASYSHISPLALEKLLPSRERLSGDLYDARQFIYLRAIHDDLVTGYLLPVVSLRYGFDKEPAEVRIRLGLAQMVNDRLLFHGFRFETPEGLGGGRHDFYHAQCISAFVQGGIALNQPDSDLMFVPKQQPSFPLRA